VVDAAILLSLPLGVAIAPERFTYKLLSSSEVFGLNFLDFKYVEKMPSETVSLFISIDKR